MKLYIVTDMEGVAGVLDWDYAEGKHLAAGNRLLAGEVRAAVQGARRAGCDRMVLFEGHGGSSLKGLRGKDITLISPRSCPTRWPYGLDASCDALMFIGQHAMAGTRRGHLSHTMNGSVKAMRINGRVVGEIGVWIMLAGAFGVPAIFLSGDEAACREARKMVPDIGTVAVKTVRGVRGVSHLPPREARARIRAGVIEALERFKARPPAPYRVRPPFVFEEMLHARRRVIETREVADRQARGIAKIDATTVRMTAPDLARILNRRREVRLWKTTGPAGSAGGRARA